MKKATKPLARRGIGSKTINRQGQPMQHKKREVSTALKLLFAVVASQWLLFGQAHADTINRARVTFQLLGTLPMSGGLHIMHDYENDGHRQDAYARASQWLSETDEITWMGPPGWWSGTFQAEVDSTIGTKRYVGSTRVSVNNGDNIVVNINICEEDLEIRLGRCAQQ